MPDGKGDANAEPAEQALALSSAKGQLAETASGKGSRAPSVAQSAAPSNTASGKGSRAPSVAPSAAHSNAASGKGSRAPSVAPSAAHSKARAKAGGEADKVGAPSGRIQDTPRTTQSKGSKASRSVGKRSSANGSGTGEESPRPRSKGAASEAGKSGSGASGQTGSSDDDDDDEPELEFDFVACGYSHTMLVTKNGGLLMACGNHRYGQLGIGEKNKEEDARNCQECTLLRAVKRCNSCIGPTAEPGKDFCMACFSTVHKKKANREHKGIFIEDPPDLKFVANPRSVRREFPKFAGSEGDGAGTDQANDDDGSSDNDADLVADYKLVDLTNVIFVACGDAHTLAIVQDEPYEHHEQVTEVGASFAASGADDESHILCGQVYAWGCCGSGRTGLVKSHAVADEEATDGEENSDEEEEQRGGKKKEIPFTDPEYENQFYAVPVVQLFGENMVESDKAPKQRRRSDSSDSSSSSSASSSEEEAFAGADSDHPEDPFYNAFQVACGGQHSLLLDKVGRVWSWGNNEYGQLGRKRAKPVVHGMKHCVHRRQVIFMPEARQSIAIQKVACGDRHCLAVGDNGRKVFSWGCADNGRLGLYKTTGYVKKPALVKSLGEEGDLEVIDISCGSAHSAAVCKGTPAKLYTWGKNDAGQCGIIPRRHMEELAKEVNRAKDEKQVKFPPTPDIHTPQRVDVAFPQEYSVTPQPAPRAAGIDVSVARARKSMDSRNSLRKKSADTSRLSAHRKSVETTMSQRRVSQLSKPSRRSSAASSRSHKTRQTSSGGAGESMGDDGSEEEEDKGMVMVACGACHTLALLGSAWTQDGTEHPMLYLLGSGLDRQPRIEDVWIRKQKKGQKQVMPMKSFEPRLIKYAFTDTAEISTKDNDDGEEYDEVIYTMKQETIPNEEDPDHPTVVEHHLFTFAFAGDLDLDAGNTIAFTGPNAPPGLRLESVDDGPWFEVLGQDDAEKAAAAAGAAGEHEAESAKAKDKKDKEQKKGDKTWDDEMGPGRKPFYLHKLNVIVDDKSENAKPFANQNKEGNCEEVVVEEAGTERVRAMLHKVEQKEQKDENAEKAKTETWLYFKTSTIVNAKPSEKNRRFQAKDKIQGKDSKASAVAVGRLEEVRDPQGNLEVVWHKSEKEKKRFTVEVSENVLTTECDTFEKVAEWITKNVSTEDTENMLVCKRADMPPLKQIASGSFHACALSADHAEDHLVLMWGMGALGRLGLGNQLEQLIPTALELGMVQVDGINLKCCVGDRLGVQIEEDLSEGGWKWDRIAVELADAKAAGAPLDHQLLEVNMQRVDLPPGDPKLEQVAEDGTTLDYARKLLLGPEDSTVVVKVAYEREADDGDQGDNEEKVLFLETYKGVRDMPIEKPSDGDDGDDGD